MESKRLIIGIGQGVWMLNPRMLAMGNQTQIALLMAEYDKYVSERTGAALVVGKYVLKNPVTAEELPLPPECDDKLMFLDGNTQFWKSTMCFWSDCRIERKRIESFAPHDGYKQIKRWRHL